VGAEIFTKFVFLSIISAYDTLLNFKYVLSTMGVSKESISKFLIGNRFPIEDLLIDSLLTPIVESTYLNRDICKFE